MYYLNVLFKCIILMYYLNVLLKRVKDLSQWLFGFKLSLVNSNHVYN